MSQVFPRTAGILLSLALLAVPTKIFSAQEQTAAPSGQRRAATNEIISRGRIEPLGRVIAVNGPPDGNSTVALVQKLQVEQGSKVERGQVLSLLNGFDLARTDLEVAKASLKLAELQRAQVQAGVGKAAEIAAQLNVIESRRAQLIRTKKDYERAFTLVRKRVESVQVFDTQKAALDQLTNDVQQAENALKALTEVRAVDDAVAEAQIAVARANVAKAEAVVERLQIRAPISGTVLSIQTRNGEAILADGILRMGDLDHLIVVAEVDQGQITRLAEGMTAKIEGDIISQPIQVSVTRVAKEVFRQKRPSSDILIGRDAKIVEVEVTPQSPLPAVVGGEVVVHFTLPSSAQK
jgi:HlyD family secretion protein